MTSNAAVRIEPTQALAEFAARLALAQVPERVIAYSKNLFLDSLACAAAGHAGEEVPQISAFASALAPGDGFTVIAGGTHSLVGNVTPERLLDHCSHDV